ncbi:saccharopine dehydrogenase family protein [Variovorax ginsengisoli]|uniref:Saccharopine dehydrogenase NADP-binding domain-containing protein n=1 Tax=Variovorax ginsengisoli TaxID=363844 RepID=A0ABT8SF76_9BURK|nr:saccharopine dehydrogenase NADP-binding domain-containing protein [Variovorax ginsengisoli]MDN8618270.1 saccharopine dehydrogenase NADP-binding domain-containing protein [Variovorax ginsengisoli]MDO1537440.1 saccharopine dehydrogenase NADP-binding domain-containing protein [Variovorax ginsengisoli]
MSRALTEHRVVVIGGYGFFGRRLVERLTSQPNAHVVVAGRSLQDAQALVEELRPQSKARLGAAVVDAMSADLPRQLKPLSPTTVVLASGPFQGQDYRVARTCISVGANYIDLADARAFVVGIRELDSNAKAAGVFVSSGASSVPALSSAAVDHLAQGMSTVRNIDIGISPGNRTERGLSTVKAILSYCGKAIPAQGPTQTIGWSGSRHHRYPAPVGSRWLSSCDVPDLALLPLRYPGAPNVQFGAGLELSFLHRGMNAMAWAARHGLVRDWSTHAHWLKNVANIFKGWGSDAGAMHVSVSGLRNNNVETSRTWSLVATHGDGPYVPTLAAAALVRKLASGDGLPAGAMPCVGSLSLEDFDEEARGLNIHMAEVAT